ncbi:hypothetical protein D3Y57_00725 (plasmid) [Sphingomonas paeninsulae]|uniref:TonB-dependent receptor n=1 Tax=Sphingomonas paeninsulae TaxID=2319844 RepID=A0A494T711_SPHPE|nr:hypothetical protein [Sphingomonas paeninsulae]AYJ84660.1 hypothetical protein D3Y57_00725 [Sphingomonas paeninsulae]
MGSELVFSGDGGTTEPNDATRCYGTEANLFWRPTNWQALDGSVGLTNARFRNVEATQNRIPNSTSNVISGGAAFEFGNGLSGSLRLRHFGSAPLIEDNSARSHPTTRVNLGGYYKLGRAKLGIDILNLFSAQNAHITYFYT